MAALALPLFADAIAALLNLVLLLTSIFLILVVLIQRGKGGGLAGAFGGAGGSSAFGSRAGDAFTRFTMWTAGFWLVIIMLLITRVQPTAPVSNVPALSGLPAPPLARRRATASDPAPSVRDCPYPTRRAKRVLYSMTGYGEASFSGDRLQIAAELKAVNNRYLKVTLRASEPFCQLEPEVEKVVRRTVKRGTVTVSLRCQRPAAAADYVINTVALRSYLKQAQAVAGELGLSGGELLGQVLALPGVVPEPQGAGLDLEEEWPVVELVVEQAIARMQQSRLKEGQAMAAQLLSLSDHIAGQLTLIRARAPVVGDLYRGRLLERVRLVLSELDVQLDRKDLIKEVAVFAERADVSEEITRLDSHLSQFHEVVGEPESAGRKLDFITQEMFRETNTIGSKASDIDISRHVVEIKGTLEKIRELVQNVE